MSIDITQIEFNDLFERAYNLIELTKKNVFITGKAGTGKSTLLKYFRENTKKKVVFLSPTGVSAINIRGQTIHSFFNFKPDITPDKAEKIKPLDVDLYKDLDAIVIDEVSMVRADLLDCIDRFLRKNGPIKKRPFGGIQMIFIGDLYQLPPVTTTREKDIFSNLYKSPYFFDAQVFRESEKYSFADIFNSDLESQSFKMEFIELEKVYRQRDEKFIEILNAIRNNTVTDEQIEILNRRYVPDFDEEAYIHLTSTNELAEKINKEKLDKIGGKEFTYHGKIKGDFQLSDLPTSLELTIKIGAQVMLLNNDSEGRWINGTIGIVEDIVPDEDYDIIFVKIGNNHVVEVVPFQWQMFRFYYDSKDKKILTHPVGTYTQYPLKLAWAITIHKSQGLTFEKVVIDVGRGTFAHGQMYVALSRCTSLDGLVLKKPITKKQILMDRRIVKFITQFQYKDSEEKCPIEKKIEILNEAIKKKKQVEIVYLKTSDEKSRRKILPVEVGEMSYNGKKFIGVKGMCNLRKEERTFAVTRILEIKEVD